MTQTTADRAHVASSLSELRAWTDYIVDSLVRDQDEERLSA